MNCTTFRVNLGALLDGDVDDHERAALLAHARCCAECRLLHESRALLRSLITQTCLDDRL